jgi:preprotein translocase subunit SecA
MDEQRKRVYGYRQAILEGANCKELILQMIDQQVEDNLRAILKPHYGAEAFAAWAGNRLATALNGRDFRDVELETAERLAKAEAETAAETQVIEAIEENLPEEEDATDWNWAALAGMAATRWGLHVRDRDLIRVGRDNVAEFLIEEARKAIQHVDLSEGREFLEETFAPRTACAWVRHKFGLEVALSEVQGLETPAIIRLIRQRAQAAYDVKESEYPVMAGLYRYSARTATGQPRIDRQGLAHWAQQRFEVEIDLEELKTKPREEIHELLLHHSRACQRKADQAIQTVKERLDQIFSSGGDHEITAGAASGNGALSSLAHWLQETLQVDLSAAELAPLERESLEKKLVSAVEDRYRPEIRKMERQLVLQIVDGAWKDHLLAMDHLRSAVGLVGYAQVDPKVEYKREGRKLFEQMWSSIGQRVTDLVFRMEQLDEGFVGSTWVETSAVHEVAPTTSEIARQQDEAIRSSQGEGKVETIRNRGQRVGRNDPCPCGSGKKYKNCCLRT